MTAGSTVDVQDEIDDDLPGVAATLQRLVAEGLGPALGLGADLRTRSAIERVARLGREELSRRLKDVFDTRYRELVGYAAGILGDRQDAQDVVQEAFARVLRTDPDLQAPEALDGYLFTAVVNQARRKGSHRSRDRAAHEAHDAVDLDTRLVSTHRSIEDKVCDDITLGLALQVLSDRQRTCIVLRFLGGLSVKDTAKQLGISEGNVKRICHEARERLTAAFAVAA
jgi:RNA polymerase sigma factor (sigma-70 family)